MFKSNQTLINCFKFPITRQTYSKTNAFGQKFGKMKFIAALAIANLFIFYSKVYGLQSEKMAKSNYKINVKIYLKCSLFDVIYAN